MNTLQKFTLVVAMVFCSMANYAQQYEAHWESLLRHKTPDWFMDAKFGIFIHWGVYSVPAFHPDRGYAEHYASSMYRGGADTRYHEATYGKLGEFGYKDFIPEFKAEKFNAEEWAELFKNAGAKLVIPVAEHHDGFAMWNSALTKWDAYDMGPKRDVIGELEKAIRRRDMKFGASYHRERHFSYFTERKYEAVENPKFLAGVQMEIDKAPETIGLYGPLGLTDEFMSDYKARWDEICEKYGPDIFWFDDIPSFYLSPDGPNVRKFQKLLKQMVAEYLNREEEWGRPLAVNNKGRLEANFPETFGIREYDYFYIPDIDTRAWMDSRGMGDSYGFNKVEDEEDRYPSTHDLIRHFVDVVSKGGVFLLNVGPKADGTISENQQKRLKGIGKWLAVNGEGIYGTRPWKTYGKDNIRYTTKGDDLYIISTMWGSKHLYVYDINLKKGTKVKWLGNGENVSWSNYDHHLKIMLPLKKSYGSGDPLNAAYVFKVEGYFAE